MNEDDVESTLECLRGKDASDITANEYSVKDYTVNFYPFVPTVDDMGDNSFLPASPAALMKLNNSINSNIPVLLGSNANEGFWSLMYYLTDLMPNRELAPQEKNLTQEEYYKAVESLFTFYPKEVN